MNWLYFLLLAGIVVVSGSKLSLYADVLAVKLRLSRSAMGALLVSIVTSLPEITTTLGSVVTVGSPDMALGNIFGSVLFNISIIAVCDFLFRQGGILRHIHTYELGPSVGSLAMIVVAALGLVYTVNVRLFGTVVGAGSLLIILLYLLFFFWIHKTGAIKDIPDEGDKVQSLSTAKAGMGFLICSVLIVVSGILLAVVGDRIAGSSGLSHSFMGALFLAIATSLPELTVGISAVRIGSVDLMVGTMMGSNMFNILVVAIADLFYAGSALKVPENLGWLQIFGAGCALLATLLVISGIVSKPKKKIRGLAGWRSIAIIALHIICLTVIYNEWI